MINLEEYLVIKSYSVTVLDNVKTETSDRAKKAYFWGGIQQPHFHSGESPPPTSMVRHLGRRFDESITLTV